MDCTLAPLAPLKIATGPDLRSELDRQRRGGQDLVVEGTGLRLAEVAGEPVVRIGDQLLPLAPPASQGLASLVPTSGPASLLRQRHDVDAWFASQAEVRVLVRDRWIIALMPTGWRTVDDLELLETMLSAVMETGLDVKLDHARLWHGEWLATLVAPELWSDVAREDFIYGGLDLTNSPVHDTEACTRIYRVLCRNGALADMNEGRRLGLPRLLKPQVQDPYVDWRQRLDRVVATSFRKGSVDEDAQRLRKAVQEILSSPYEHLCHLRAQKLITAEEQVLIQREFSRAGDQTLYGLINAITSIAHQHRSEGEWRAAMMMERLGGEILRGDHMPPTLSPTFHR